MPLHRSLHPVSALRWNISLLQTSRASLYQTYPRAPGPPPEKVVRPSKPTPTTFSGGGPGALGIEQSDNSRNSQIHTAVPQPLPVLMSSALPRTDPENASQASRRGVQGGREVPGVRAIPSPSKGCMIWSPPTWPRGEIFVDR